MCLQDILESCVIYLNSPNPQMKGEYYIIAIQICRISSVYSKWVITICHTVCHWTFPSMHIFLLLTLVRSAHRLTCLLLALLTPSCLPPSFLRELSLQLCHWVLCTASALSLLRLINGCMEKTEMLSYGELNCQLYYNSRGTNAMTRELLAVFMPDKTNLSYGLWASPAYCQN